VVPLNSIKLARANLHDSSKIFLSFHFNHMARKNTFAAQICAVVGRGRNMNDAKSTRFLNEREVAAVTGLSVKTLQRWRVLQTGPKYRKLSGCAVRYNEAELLRWIESQPVGGDK
jgi:predicted DNA-binding transcriptional regulator AlpA